MKNRSRPPNMLGLKFEIAMLPVLRVPFWHDCSVRVDPAYRKMLLRTCVICSSHTDTSSGALPSEEFTNLHDVAPKWQINGGAYCSSCVSFARLDIANCPKLRAPLYAESESCVDLDHFIIPKQLPRSYAGVRAVDPLPLDLVPCFLPQWVAVLIWLLFASLETFLLILNQISARSGVQA